MPTDIFKFVALRPVQLATEDQSKITVIRDSRSATSAGLKKLATFAQQISSPALATKRWEEVDLQRFAPLIAGRRKLAELYRNLSEDQEVPPAAQLAAEADLAEIDPEEKAAWEELWDALYIAHASGPDAGVRLDGPTAALRTLHFLALTVETPAPAAALALSALSATPAIDISLDERLRPSRGGGGGTRTPATTPPQDADPTANVHADEAGAALARRLAGEVQMTQMLQQRLGAASAAGSPSVVVGPVNPFGSWSQQSLNVSTSRTVESVLGVDVTRLEANILDTAGVSADTPVGEARTKLERHLSALGDRALALSEDPSFQDALVELTSTGELTFPPPLAAQAARAAPIDPSTAPDVAVHGRIKPLGIGDLKVVKQTLLAYEPGEVAYIENVLGGESKSRVHRALHRTTTTLFESQEDTRDTQRDTQSTDRYELKRETNNTIKEDMSIRAGLQVTASYGPVVAHASGDFAYSTSREDSQKTSSNFARDVVERSITKVQIRTVTSRTVTTTDETEETNTHGVDNSYSETPVVGVYRWVDKRYRAQIYNYGSRLMLEFVVPEPAAFYRVARSGRKVQVDAVPPAPFLNDLTPLLPRTHWRQLSASDITESNYGQYAARYGAAGVTPPPADSVYVSAALQKDAVEDGKSVALVSKDFVVPDGYVLGSHRIAASVLWVNNPKFTVQVGDQLYIVLNQGGGFSALTTQARGSTWTSLSPVKGPVAVSVTAYDVHAFALNVQGVCTREPAHFAKWQLQTYDKILVAYRALQDAYDQKVAAATRAAHDADVVGQNPGLNREIEKAELKKLCITMMTGQHFSEFNAVTAPDDAPLHHPEVDVLEALLEGPIVQFFEQAFEWEQMTYLFYPYFWGSKQKWVERYGITDPDPLFQQFLTAGSCRVVVPVPVAYVDAVRYLLQSRASNLAERVWLGGEPPTLDSDLYVSLAEELRNQTDDLAGAVPEGDPWEFKLPTTLVWLQPDGTLPTFP